MLERKLHRKYEEKRRFVTCKNCGRRHQELFALEGDDVGKIVEELGEEAIRFDLESESSD